MKKFKTKIRIRYLDPDDVRLYLATVRAAFRPLFQLLISTGMRLGEGLALRVCDLRLGSEEARVLIEDSKTESGVRPEFVPVWAADTLRVHVDSEGLSGTDRLFTFPQRTVQREHSRACKLAGIINYTIHDHKHTAAVALSRAGMPLHLLQQQLGHSAIAMTMRYARFHPDYGDVNQYFERVADLYGVSSADPRCKSGCTPEPAQAEITP